MRYARALFLFFCLLVTAYSFSAGSGRDTYWQTSTSTASAKPLIYLDAGHGGSDEGAKVSAFKEKRLTLLTTLLTKKHLEELGYRVVLTRGRDIFLPLQKRVALANNAKATMFVSIHFNSSPNADAHGIEVFYYDSKEHWRGKASKRLANCVLYRLIDQTDAISRGVKMGNFHVIRETDMPAVLVEAGFLTNYNERQKLKDRDYLNRVSIGIAQGIDKYFKT